MSYNLEFTKSALEEYGKLYQSIKSQFRKKLKERLENPHVQADKLSGMPDCYKIKLRKSGFRLIYRVVDNQLVVEVIKISKRDSIYKNLSNPP